MSNLDADVVALRDRTIAGLRAELDKRETDLIVVYADNDQLRETAADLLAALKALFDEASEYVDAVHPVMEKAYAAIAKAEGVS